MTYSEIRKNEEVLAFIKKGNVLYHRVGADEYNNCDILSSTDVENTCNTKNINYNDLNETSMLINAYCAWVAQAFRHRRSVMSGIS
jgi:NADH:ubiquinone oxidoreductase subunit